MRWNPEVYNQTKTHRIQLFKDLLNWAGMADLSNKKLLDIGCGDGAIDAFAAKQWHNLNIKAIDADQQMIQFAKKQNTTIDFEAINAEDFSAKADFDMVISLSCLHWIENQKQVLSNVYQSLKPDGTALFMICPEQAYVWQALTKTSQQAEWRQYFENFSHGYHFFTTEQYQTLAEAAGFSVQHIELVHENLGLDTQADLEKLISGWIPHLEPLPSSLQPAFLNQACELTLTLMQADGLSSFKDSYGSTLNVLLKKN